MNSGPEPSGGDAPPAGSVTGQTAPDGSVVARVFRESSGRAVATLTRVFRGIDLAEDAVQETFAVAIERWRCDGLPPNPGGWIVTTARRKALDRLRRESTRPGREVQAARLAGLDETGEAEGEVEPAPVRDDQLRLIFTCC